MNLVEDKIVHLLTGKHNLFEVSVDELQAISDEQPFFSVAQLLLTQKMKQVNHPGFVQQLQKTALFFPNIFWLDKHLQESSTQSSFPVTSTPTATPSPSYTSEQPSYIHTPKPEPPGPLPAIPEATASPSYYNNREEEDLNPIVAQYGQSSATPMEPTPAESFVTAALDEPVTEQKTAEPVAAAWEEPAVHIAETQPEQEVIPAPVTEITQESSMEPIPAVEVTAPVWNYTAPTIELVDEHTTESIEVIAQPVTAPFVAPELEAAAAPPVNDVTIEQEPPVSVIAPDTQEQAAEYEHSIKESFATTINDAPAIDEDNLPVDALGETDDAGVPNMRLAEMMQQQAATFHKPIAENETLAIESEPYHTIDYFASQGIKAEGAEDGLAKKVRKFTDWLKQMKKVAPQPSDLGTDAELEKVVHGIAATSIEAKEVVTEAMADVLVKQGKIDKAVLLYSKLSFLNPDKTAYFAGKIIELKGN